MSAARTLSPASCVVLLLDRVVSSWWICLVCMTAPLFVMALEPVGTMQDGLLRLGGPLEQAVVVEVEMTNTTINSVPVWKTQLALVSDERRRSVGYSTGMAYALDDSVTVQCALVTCAIFQASGTRSTRLGLGWNLSLGAVAVFMGLFPVRTLWRRRWWVAALRRGAPTRGWVDDDSDSDEQIQRLNIHYDDARDSRWQQRFWFGYRSGFVSQHLHVLYVPLYPRRAVALETLPDWMGDRIPDFGEAWPAPDRAGWLRVGIGGGILLGAAILFWTMLG